MGMFTGFPSLDHAGKIFRDFYWSHPRIPPERDGVQVNHCKSPVCLNYGVAPGQSSVRGSNSYILDSRNKGISSCICTSCGEGFPLKSNLGIAEEVERMASYLPPPSAVCCRNDACATIPIRCLSVPLGRMPRSARLRLATPAGAVRSAVRRSHRTPRQQHGSENITRTRAFSNCWSTRCPCGASSKSRTSTPRPSTTDSPTASELSPTSPSAGCTSASTDRTT